MKKALQELQGKIKEAEEELQRDLPAIPKDHTKIEVDASSFANADELKTVDARLLARLISSHASRDRSPIVKDLLTRSLKKIVIKKGTKALNAGGWLELDKNTGIFTVEFNPSDLPKMFENYDNVLVAAFGPDHHIAVQEQEFADRTKRLAATWKEKIKKDVKVTVDTSSVSSQPAVLDALCKNEFVWKDFQAALFDVPRDKLLLEAMVDGIDAIKVVPAEQSKFVLDGKTLVVHAGKQTFETWNGQMLKALEGLF